MNKDEPKGTRRAKTSLRGFLINASHEPFLSVPVLMIIAPAILLSKDYRKEVNEGSSLEAVTLWILVVLGIAGWIGLLVIAVQMVLRLIALW